MRFFEVEQSNLHFMGEREKKNIKKALYDFLKDKFLRKMTILIMLGALVKNTNKY